MFKFVNSLSPRLLNLPILRKLPRVNASYQFRVEAPVYYPNRDEERKRAESYQSLKIRKSVPDYCVPSLRQEIPENYRQVSSVIRKQPQLEQVKAAYYNLTKMFNGEAKRRAPEIQRFKEISNVYKTLIDESNKTDCNNDDATVAITQKAFIRTVHELANTIDEKKETKRTNLSVNSNQQNRDKKPLSVSHEELLKLANVTPKLELTFEEAAHGLRRNYTLRFAKKCPSCLGKSPMLANRSNPEICRKCFGVGTITKHTATYSSTVPCDRCNGNKFTKRDQCAACENRGLVLDHVLIPLKIPPGTKTGDILTVENPVTKKRVSFRMNVLDNVFFERKGNDIHSTAQIKISEAVLGCNYSIRGLDGKIPIRVPPGSDSHTKLVVKGKGISSNDGVVGDHVVTLKIAIPKILSTRQRQLLLSLAQTEDPTIDYED